MVSSRTHDTKLGHFDSATKFSTLLLDRMSKIVPPITAPNATQELSRKVRHTSRGASKVGILNGKSRPMRRYGSRSKLRPVVMAMVCSLRSLTASSKMNSSSLGGVAPED
jgi:hypothetical protein